MNKEKREWRQARFSIEQRGYKVSLRHIKKIERYVWGRACKKYVRYCASHCWFKLAKLATRSGIDIEVLRRKRSRYDAFEGPVPLAYLRAIGVDLDILQRCEQIDRIEYCDADSLGWLPREYEYQSAFDTSRFTFPDYVAELHQALIYLWREAERASEPCRYNMVWPGIKSITVWSDTPPRFELTTRRPVLWLNNDSFEDTDDDDVAAAGKSAVLELRPTSIADFERGARPSGEPRANTATTFCDPHSIFDRARQWLGITSEVTLEQKALHEPIVMLLDKIDPLLMVDAWRSSGCDWSSEIGFREYVLTAAVINLQITTDMSIEDAAAIIYAQFDSDGWGAAWGFDERNRDVSTEIAQEISNARRRYHGEPPKVFDPLPVYRFHSASNYTVHVE